MNYLGHEVLSTIILANKNTGKRVIPEKFNYLTNNLNQFKFKATIKKQYDFFREIGLLEEYTDFIKNKKIQYPITVPIENSFPIVSNELIEGGINSAMNMMAESVSEYFYPYFIIENVTQTSSGLKIDLAPIIVRDAPDKIKLDMFSMLNGFSYNPNLSVYITSIPSSPFPVFINVSKKDLEEVGLFEKPEEPKKNISDLLKAFSQNSDELNDGIPNQLKSLLINKSERSA